MKKLITTFYLSMLILFLSNTTQAQGRYDKGDFLLNVGFGLGGYYYAGGVPLMLSGEFVVNPNFTVGPYLGYTSYNYRSSGFKYSYTFFDIGVRGSYHFSEPVGVTNEKVDLYAGASLGFLASSYTGDDYVGYKNPYPAVLRLGIHAGVRYYFAERVAGYAELGYGFAPLALGVTFKF